MPQNCLLFRKLKKPTRRPADEPNSKLRPRKTLPQFIFYWLILFIHNNFLIFQYLAFAALYTFSKRQATVIGPTPPGTGDTREAVLLTDAKSTSPTTPPAPSSEVPASIIILPCFIFSPVIKLGLPTAEIITSASLSNLAMFSVLLRATACGQPLCSKKKLTGRPASWPKPIIKLCLVFKSIPHPSKIFITALAVGYSKYAFPE